MKKILLFFVLFFSFTFSVFAETYDTYILDSDLNKISNFEFNNFINFLEENKTSNSSIASAKKLIDNDNYVLKFNPFLNYLFLFELKDYSSLNSIDFSNTSCVTGSQYFCNINYSISSRYAFRYDNSIGSFSYSDSITVVDDFFIWKFKENNVINSSLLVYSSYSFKLVQNLNFSDGTTYLEKDKIYQGIMPLFGENQQKFYTLKFNIPKDSILILRDSNNNIIENIDNSFDLLPGTYSYNLSKNLYKPLSGEINLIENTEISLELESVINSSNYNSIIENFYSYLLNLPGKIFSFDYPFFYILIASFVVLALIIFLIKLLKGRF